MPEKSGTKKKRKSRTYKKGPLNINGQLVPRGENALVKINVGRLPSDAQIDINIFVHRSQKPGPVALVMGGVHGDEINGVEIVRRALDQGLYANLLRGSVITIPLLNVFGFINFSREVPDGKDVNRSFPGNMRGSLASRVARVVSRIIMPEIDFGMDFHTGGGSRYNYPQVRYSRQSVQSLTLARYFAPPFIIKKPLIRRSLRQVARDQNIPLLVYEGGEALRLDGFAITKGLQGLQRVLASKRMIEPDPDDRVEPSLLFEKTSWVRASASGIFTWSKCSGMKVRQGEPLGTITDPYGSRKIMVLANKSGYILGHNNASVINQGDALFNIGYQFKTLEPKKMPKQRTSV